MNQVIGTCSLCGGDVEGFVGAWLATIPPPPGRCVQCGAEEARGPVIVMRPRYSGERLTRTTISTSAESSDE